MKIACKFSICQAIFCKEKETKIYTQSVVRMNERVEQYNKIIIINFFLNLIRIEFLNMNLDILFEYTTF